MCHDQHHDPRAYLLVGETASGKSAVAQYLARQGGFSILSADSMQVYRGLDVGTAKATTAERGEVPYFGLDLVGPDEAFDVAAWLDAARAALAGPRPVIVTGGTGLYIKALVAGIDSPAPVDPDQRAALNAELEVHGVAALAARLEAEAPALYAALDDPQNPRRVIRALEMGRAGSTQPPRQWREAEVASPICGLRWEREILHSRIEQRVRAMYDGGLLAEASVLRRAAAPLSATAAQAIGYAEAFAVLDGACSREAAIARTIVRTRQYAKRQRTWFRRQANVTWIRCSEQVALEATAEAVMAAWRAQGPTPLRGLNDGGVDEQ